MEALKAASLWHKGPCLLHSATPEPPTPNVWTALHGYRSRGVTTFTTEPLFCPRHFPSTRGHAILTNPLTDTPSTPRCTGKKTKAQRGTRSPHPGNEEAGGPGSRLPAAQTLRSPPLGEDVGSPPGSAVTHGHTLSDTRPRKPVLLHLWRPEVKAGFPEPKSRRQQGCGKNRSPWLFQLLERIPWPRPLPPSSEPAAQRG